MSLTDALAATGATGQLALGLLCVGKGGRSPLALLCFDLFAFNAADLAFNLSHDLLYRLNVVPIAIPPLRERSEDLEPLARHFLALAVRENARPGLGFAPGAIDRLRQESWPGNVRQLANLIERLVLLADDRTIAVADVERELQAGARARSADSLEATRGEAERLALRDALARCRGNRTQAARLLGISRRTLYNKLGQHGIE